MSRPRSTRSSSSSLSGHYGRGLGGISELYDAAAAYGEPALSDASSDEQIARAISESKRTIHLEAQRRSPTVSRAYSYASSSSSSTLLGSDSGSSSNRSAISYVPTQAYYPGSPTPTPRYAADEIIARNLARSWDVASVQSDIIANPQYMRAAAGPPLVVRSPSPSTLSTTSSSSSQRTAYQSPSRPLSPLGFSTRLRTPSVRSMASISSVRSAASAQSASSVGSASSRSTLRSTSSRVSTQSISSLLSRVTRSSRHAPLQTAALALRASLPPSLARSSSSASVRSSTTRGNSRASSVRSAATAASSLTARGITVPEREALAHLHALATSPVRCTNPGCGTLIPPVSLDSIPFPTIFNADASPPRALFAALHARCPACTQSHCRGCGVATGCEVGCCSDLARVASTALVHVPRPNPSPSAASYASPGPRNAYNAIYPPPPCPIPSHCPAARALGALAALIAFDRAHIAMGARDHGRAADKPLIGPLHALVFFLSPPPRAPSPPASGLLMLADDNPDDGDEDVPEAHAALPALLGLSRVPAYAAALLRVGAGTNAGVDVGTWMARAPAYGAVLRVLRAVGDAGCTSVLGRPVRGGAGTAAWLRGAREEVWRDDAGAETLRSLIRRLEGARVALLRLAGATTFGPTVEKAHALCDGVLYLLLQDVLGEDEGQ